MRSGARIALWTLAFAVFIAGALAVAVVNRADSAVFGLPTLLAIWILFQGGMFATRRSSVIACAVVSSVLLLLQIGLLAFFVLWNRGFGNTTMATQSLVLIIWVLVGGILLVGWFLRAKIRRST